MKPGDETCVRWDRGRDPPHVVDQRRSAGVALLAVERFGERLRAISVEGRPVEVDPLAARTQRGLLTI